MMHPIKKPKPESSRSIVCICEHTGKIGGMCVYCRQKLLYHDDLCVALGYVHRNFSFSNSDLLRLRDNYTNKLLSRKKLCLVLDLDHTLLNSSIFSSITSRDREYFNSASPDAIFRTDDIKSLTKLRPFVGTFLKEASNLFEMCVYTLGDRRYALQMVKLLDPEKIYFKSRIISRDDCMVINRKSLDVVLAQEHAVVILDDSRVVWANHLGNLIEIGRYHYFASSRKEYGLNRKSFSEEGCDERESDGPLASVLEILKGVHGLFFDEESKVNLGDRDVREVLKAFKDKIKLLQGK